MGRGALSFVIATLLAACAGATAERRAAPAVAAVEGSEQVLRMAEALAGVSHAERADTLLRVYAARHKRAPARRLDGAALLDRFKAAEVTAFYTHDPATALRQRDLHGQLHARGLATGAQAGSVLAALVQSRELDAARAFNERFGIVPAGDLVRYAYDRTPAPPPVAGVPILTIDGALLAPHWTDLSGDLRIVVIAHPSCAFSRQAAIAIDADPVLGPTLREYAQWVAPPLREPTNAIVQGWNAQHPRQRMAMVDRVTDWPMLRDWTVPAFHVFRDGRLVDSIHGWPADGASADALHRIISLRATGRAQFRTVQEAIGG